MLTVIFAWEIPLSAFAETVDTAPMEADFFRSHFGVCVGHLQLADLALQLHLAGGVDLEAFDLCTLFQRDGCGCRQAFAQLQGLQLTADGQRGLGAEGEASAFSGAVLDRDTDAALFAFFQD